MERCLLAADTSGGPPMLSTSSRKAWPSVSDAVHRGGVCCELSSVASSWLDVGNDLLDDVQQDLEETRSATSSWLDAGHEQLVGHAGSEETKSVTPSWHDVTGCRDSVGGTASESSWIHVVNGVASVGGQDETMSVSSWMEVAHQQDLDNLSEASWMNVGNTVHHGQEGVSKIPTTDAPTPDTVPKSWATLAGEGRQNKPMAASRHGTAMPPLVQQTKCRASKLAALAAVAEDETWDETWDDLDWVRSPQATDSRGARSRQRITGARSRRR